MDEGDSTGAMRQYLQSYMLAARQQDKDDETMRQEMRGNIRLATENYQVALAANKLHQGPEYAQRQGYILQNLGDLTLVLVSSELQLRQAGDVPDEC